MGEKEKSRQFDLRLLVISGGGCSQFLSRDQRQVASVGDDEEQCEEVESRGGGGGGQSEETAGQLAGTAEEERLAPL